MGAVEDVVRAAGERAAALADGDAARLAALLHDDFGWTAHTGERFDKPAYLLANTGGRTVWRGQDLGDPDVVVVGDVAVLRTVVTDTIATASGSETFRMPMTQVWVRASSGWLCLGGHAGPRVTG